LRAVRLSARGKPIRELESPAGPHWQPFRLEPASCQRWLDVAYIPSHYTSQNHSSKSRVQRHPRPAVALMHLIATLHFNVAKLGAGPLEGLRGGALTMDNTKRLNIHCCVGRPQTTGRESHV